MVRDEVRVADRCRRRSTPRRGPWKPLDRTRASTGHGDASTPALPCRTDQARAGEARRIVLRTEGDADARRLKREPENHVRGTGGSSSNMGPTTSTKSQWWPQ